MAANVEAAEPQSRDSLQTEQNKMYVRFCINWIFGHFYPHLSTKPDNMDDIVDSLFDKVWPKVCRETMNFAPDTFSNLNRKIQQDVSQSLGTPQVQLSVKDPVIEECIVSTLEKHFLGTHRESFASRLRRLWRRLMPDVCMATLPLVITAIVLIIFIM